METDSTLLASVDAAVASAGWITPADGAAVNWLRHLASLIDRDPEQIAKVGKLFESAMSVLGLNIAGRNVKPENPKKDVNRLDEIKKESADRLRDATNHDTTAQIEKPRRRSGGNGEPGRVAVDEMASKRGARNSKSDTGRPVGK